ncbi:Longitudinals lacking protein-like [Dirofilaria immitis]
MINSSINDRIFHLKGDDFQQHCNNIGQYLRELRMKRDLSTADIEIICDQMQTDFLHSTVGALYSSYIRTMLKNHQTSFRISLLNYQYKIVSAIIDWMYIGEIQVKIEEYGEHLKIVNNLGIDKLQQNLENALEILATQNDCIIHCINIATDHECLVSSITRKIICEKFIATMHTLLDTDIQKLTLNAVIALVAYPCIILEEKIDIINFALQWLKNLAHLQFLDIVLESFRIEALQSNQLILLVQHLRRLFQELPKNLLASIRIYICNKQIIISNDSTKYAKIDSSETISEVESKCKSMEIGKMIDDEINATETINKLPNFDELIKIYQPINSNNEALIDDHTLKDLSEFREISNFSSKHQIPQGFFHYSTNIENSLDIRLAAAGTSDEKSDKVIKRLSNGSNSRGNTNSTSNQFPSRNSDITTATSTEERTIGRNAISSDSVAEIQQTPNPFSCDSAKSYKTISADFFDRENIIETDQMPTLFSNRSGIAEYARTSDESGKKSLSPSTETINRNLHGAESITDIAIIPKQFYDKKYFTPNLDHYPGGSRAICNLTEQIRQMKDKLYGFESFRNMRNSWRNREISEESDLQTVNRYAFSEQSLADINDISSQFSIKHYSKRKENSPSEILRSSPYRIESMTDLKAIPDPFSLKESLSSEHSFEHSPKKAANFQNYPAQFHARYTTSEIEDINAYPEFVREDQLIGKKALTRDEYEELRAIPSITSNESEKLPIINRYELPDDEINDIKNLPNIVDSQCTIGRNIRSEEEIREIQTLPDIGMKNSGLLSAYVAPPSIYPQHFDSSASSSTYNIMYRS